jgi:hypothetical protein
VAVAVFTYARDGELRVLRWDEGDVDLEHGVLSITRAYNRRTGEAKGTKTDAPRRVPIEANLLPLLRALHDAAKGKGAQAKPLDPLEPPDDAPLDDAPEDAPLDPPDDAVAPDEPPVPDDPPELAAAVPDELDEPPPEDGPFAAVVCFGLSPLASAAGRRSYRRCPKAQGEYARKSHVSMPSPGV